MKVNLLLFCLLLPLTACQRKEPVLEATSTIVESSSETEANTDPYYVNNTIKYEGLGNKTKEEYREDWIELYKPQYVECDEDAIKSDLDKIDDKFELGEYLYNNIYFSTMPDSGEAEVTHEDEVYWLLFNTGYIILPDYWDVETQEGFDAEYDKYLELATVENGIIDEEIWNEFSIEEAREHVLKCMKNNADYHNLMEDREWESRKPEEKIKEAIEFNIQSEEEKESFYDDLQREVDAIYEKQSQNK